MKKSDLLKDKPKTEDLEVRLSEKQKAYVATRAMHYGYKSMSEWARYCLINYKPPRNKKRE